MAFQKTKIDPELGRRIHKHLINKGVETPLNENNLYKETKDKIELLEKHFTEIWTTVGLDLNDDSLSETPKRMAKMWILETMWGLIPENFPKCTTITNKMQYDEMVVESNVNVQSNCEHHGVVIDGLATVAYIPKNTVLGLSKLNRIVEYFSKRPQVQERLTEQVYHTLQYILETDDVAVYINAKHYCVKSRGVEDANSTTITSKLGGAFKINDSTRSEFLSIARTIC